MSAIGCLLGLGLLGRLLSQIGYIAACQLRAFGAKTSGDVIGHGRDVVVGIALAEGRHEDLALGCLAIDAMDDRLRHIGGTGIVYRAYASKSGIAIDLTDAGPVMAAGASAGENLFAARIGIRHGTFLVRWRRRQSDGARQVASLGGYAAQIGRQSVHVIWQQIAEAVVSRFAHLAGRSAMSVGMAG